MGCVLCNITNVESFTGTNVKFKITNDTGKTIEGVSVYVEPPKVPNPFYCATEDDKKLFLDELAGDIATRHSELVWKIVCYYLRYVLWDRHKWRMSRVK
ncbi:MAG: hypothetical protein PHI12_07495 [Dehalococcoidales bacterium]|nr:hypothetical protein [Dehalococcoidales bacterium]